MSDLNIQSNLVTEQVYTWIRRQNIEFNITGCKPNTQHYAYFDRTPVNHLIVPSNGKLGDPIITNSDGNASGTFIIPSYTFYTGNRELLFSDENTYPNKFATQSSDASATFTSRVVRATVKDTIRTIQLVPEHWTRWGDPLAQSFFTFGTEGGVSVSSIDIFFQKKDPTVPITLEIRELNNGYPSEKLVYPYARAVLSASDVNVSLDASLGTNFKFPVPIFLPENQGYCFVLLSNSDKYWVWTSKMGEKSIESGTYISSQPYIGSLFKSENNITWTAEQDSDIKFTLNRAKFTSSSAIIKFGAKSEPVLLKGSNLSVTSGSPIVKIKFDHYHGLLNGDSIEINGQNYFLNYEDDENARDNITYRGISGEALTGTFDVSYINDYEVTISVSEEATSTGDLSFPGIVNDLQIESGGQNHTINGSRIVFSGGGSNPDIEQATAEIISIKNGSIIGVKMKTHGKGYTSIPNITIVGGSNTKISIISESIFKITTNRQINEYLPRISALNPPYTSIDSYLVYTRKSSNSFVQINSTSISSNKINLNTPYTLPYRGTLLSKVNNREKYFTETDTSTELVLDLKTNNDKISPIVSTNERHQLESRCYVINNQEGEDLNQYSLFDEDLQAILPATGFDPNSELYARGGTAQSRYVTKQFILDTISTGIRLYLNAYSEINCNIDVYIRTSLSTEITDNKKHYDLDWRKLYCDVERNLSKSINDFIDYTFYLDNITPFDTYDLKIVMRSSDNHKAPTIKNYRAIILS